MLFLGRHRYLDQGMSRFIIWFASVGLNISCGDALYKKVITILEYLSTDLRTLKMILK